MIVVGVEGSKGGCGKSQVATNMSVAFTLAGRKVAVIDCDPQGTSEKWSIRRNQNAPVVRTATHSNLERRLMELDAEDFDITFIDVEGTLNQVTLLVPKFADYVIIPCQPSLPDLESIADTVEAVAARNKPYSIILNRVSSLTNEGNEADEFIRGVGVNVAECRLGERTAYRKAMIGGMSVLEYEPDGKAANEVMVLYRYICDELGVPNGIEMKEVA